jgi:hypothetical protein
MHFPTISTSLLTVLPSLALAHSESIPGLPKVVGYDGFNFPSFKQRDVLGSQVAPEPQPEAAKLSKRGIKKARQNTEDQCGGSFGSCAAGYCCSPAVRILPASQYYF